MIVEIISPVECQVSKREAELIKPCLSFSAQYYIRKQFNRERREYQKTAFSGSNGSNVFFWYGLLARVRRFCKAENIPLEIKGGFDNLLTKNYGDPKLDGITFRPDQLNLMKSALIKRRGIIKSPTGSGKTLLQFGIMSCFHESRILMLAHTLDIISQTADRLREYFPAKDIGVFAEGKKETDKRITVATIQSIGNPLMMYEELLKVMAKSADLNWWLQKLQVLTENMKGLVERVGLKNITQLLRSKTPEAIAAEKMNKEIKKCSHAVSLLERRNQIERSANLIRDFLVENEVVIVDEVHHLSTLEGAYACALSHTFATVRLGFTATLPTDNEAIFTYEGLLGPLIKELTINEAAEKGILAVPKIRILRSPYNYDIDREYNYERAYDLGIVQNDRRNELIINTAIDYINEGKSLLVMVSKIAHGENLIAMAEKICGLSKKEFDTYFRFIQGKTTSDVRLEVKKALNSKKISCVIATTIWCEGIDLPELSVVFNVSGGKAEIRTLQIIGRGLRKTKNKDSVIIVDIFDPHSRFLIGHFGERVSLYSRLGWL